MARPYGASPSLHPSCRPPPSPLIFLSLSPSLPNPKSPFKTIQQPFAPPPHEFRPRQDINIDAAHRGFFRLIFINIKARPGQQCCCCGCWSRDEHLLRDRVQVRSRSSDHANKTVEESIRLRRINRKSNNSLLVADVDSIMFTRVARF